jgi:hypothetical protein
MVSMRGIRNSMVALGSGLILLALLMSACGKSGDGSGTRDLDVAPPKASSTGNRDDSDFSDLQRQRTVSVARNDPGVEAVMGVREGRLAGFVPVRSSDGTKLEGAVVTMRFERALTLDHRRLPAQILPNELAPVGTPPIRRSYSCSATGVTELEVRVDRDTGQVVEIVPAGPNAKISEMRLIGPPVGRYYQPVPTED